MGLLFYICIIMADIKGNPEVIPQNRAAEGVPFGNILNFRDVGRTVNNFLGEKWVALSPISIAAAQRRARDLIFR